MTKKAKKAPAAHGKKHEALRDAIAIEAMQGLIAGRGFAPASDAGAAAMLARSAYAIADAMIAERSHEDTPPET